MLSEDAELRTTHWPEIGRAIPHFDYDKIFYSAFLWTESIAYDHGLDPVAADYRG